MAQVEAISQIKMWLDTVHESSSTIAKDFIRRKRRVKASPTSMATWERPINNIIRNSFTPEWLRHIWIALLSPHRLYLFSNKASRFWHPTQKFFFFRKFNYVHMSAHIALSSCSMKRKRFLHTCYQLLHERLLSWLQIKLQRKFMALISSFFRMEEHQLIAEFNFRTWFNPEEDKWTPAAIKRDLSLQSCNGKWALKIHTKLTQI